MSETPNRLRKYVCDTTSGAGVEREEGHEGVWERRFCPFNVRARAGGSGREWVEARLVGCVGLGEAWLELPGPTLDSRRALNINVRVSTAKRN